jgi:Zn-dependent oligopeptidase
MLGQAGTRVKRDVVELMSQSVEQFFWELSVLSGLRHYERRDEVIPAELMAAKVKAKNFFSGRDMLRQMTFARYSLGVHSADFVQRMAAGATDTTRYYDELRRAVLPHIAYEDSKFECAFSHLLGYGACYYGYAYSDVMADDVFDYIKNHAPDGDIRDPVQGDRFKRLILGPGGSVEPAEMVANFLGRPFNSDAYFKKLGLN